MLSSSHILLGMGHYLRLREEVVQLRVSLSYLFLLVLDYHVSHNLLLPQFLELKTSESPVSLLIVASIKAIPLDVVFNVLEILLFETCLHLSGRIHSLLESLIAPEVVGLDIDSVAISMQCLSSFVLCPILCIVTVD